MSRTLPYNATITSNPSQATQQTEEEPDFWLGNPRYNTPAVASPGSMHPTTDIYGVDEDTSHHDSSFDDLLTTEASSENPLSEHTTPQELIWEQQFISHDSSQPHIVDSYDSHEFDAAQATTASSELQRIFQHSEETLPKFISGQELLSSKSSMAGSPLSQPTHSHNVHLNEPHAMDMPSAHHRRTVSQNLKVDTTPNQTPSPGYKVGAWQQAPNIRARSPVVTISDYETSYLKSPTTVTHIPTSAKRSRRRDSSDDGDEDEDGSGVLAPRNVDGITSYLMPPDASSADNLRTGSSPRVGVEPNSRDNEVVDSFKDIADKRQLEERNDHVEEWLATSDAGSEPGDQGPSDTSRRTPQASRRRAHTAGTHVDALGPVYSDAHIPGPGALVDVETDDEYFDDSEIEMHTELVVQDYHESGSPQISPRALDSREEPDETPFPALELDAQLDPEEPHPNQFIRRGPWQDPDSGPYDTTKQQPNTSNAAAYKFNQEAAKWETSSRAATWGTRRRLSESEVNSIVDGSQVRHLSLSKRGRERTSSILSKARGIFPRRSSSNIKEEPSVDRTEPVVTGHAHRSSVGSIKPAQRAPSWGKPKSPSISTGGAFLAMTGQLAAVGRGNSVAHEVDTAKSSRPLQALKKQRSKSDVGKNAKSPGGLADLLTRHGGPPVPTLASPMHEREPILAAQIIDNEEAPADEDEDEADELAIKMNLAIRAENILPTIEGFRDHARKLNPRLAPYLLDRVAQEQIRRYKKLVETKIRHTRSVQVAKKCSSGKFCFDLGGEARLLAPRVSSKDPDTTLTQFQVSNPADEEVDDAGFTDGIVTPALFPTGIPLPPVQRLPAEFECNICFKVKKFQKPSDWTKHVHEDIQPFSCTFPNCSESKSFKRKADWVRHENERHRHLEWWKCSVQECNHICYRKDNFVQHLVREHKMTEPKMKRGSGSSKNKPVNNGFAEDSEVWRLVEDCRFETEKKPHDEPCPFCGNICSTFKKLAVHMGKHMEQIAMPVLQLVDMRQVSPDTIISPIEQPHVVPPAFAANPGSVNTADPSNLSPYPTSANSAYQPSSAGQSPSSMHGRLHNGGYYFDQPYYSPHAMTPATQGPMMGNGFGGNANYIHQSSPFIPSPQAGPHHDHNLSLHAAMVTPRSQPTTQRHESSFYKPAGGTYPKAAMQQTYPSTHSHSHSMPMYSTGQYGQSMLQSHVHAANSGGMNVNVQTGLGLQTPLTQHPQQQYMYEAQGSGLTEVKMHFA
ncbi:hypothetical protein A1O7_07494 [Cladophialophora yegresii CBS 114405]|uniref:C2H2-type domain-containing protein n=1 Tax=Cladophialophora yegresii CBS 114405 TaxID=1182544 RepID=W9WF52_9EURO|nr:uncharacterized protein A1O7_07494 [Cladophialophora yegresii CBS 114405]EXJ57149.1 hypothetical protein A1O7_07494 [Cladophialophora yegresii CBS 114405]